MHEIVELELPVSRLSKLSDVLLDVQRGDEFARTRVQWSDEKGSL